MAAMAASSSASTLTFSAFQRISNRGKEPRSFFPSLAVNRSAWNGCSVELSNGKALTGSGSVGGRRKRRGPVFQLRAETDRDESDVSSSTNDAEGEIEVGGNDAAAVQIPLQLPRRSAQLSFTCNLCGVRSTRMVNPHAIASGTVFVQCAGCERYHQIVDNLGLIEEYNFKKEAELERQFEASPDVRDNL